MLIGSSVDYAKEIATKKEYQPPADIRVYMDAQWREFMYDQTQFLKQYPMFNDRNFIDYMKLAEEDLYKFVPKPRDPFDWRNFVRTGGERAGLDNLLSFLIDLNFQCEPESRDFTGAIDTSMGEVAGALIKFVNILDESDVKDPATDLAMFTHGTVIKQVKFNTIKGIGKIAQEWNPKKFDGYSYTTRLVDKFEGVESTIMKPNRVYFSDVGQPMIGKQEHIWHEAIIPYGNAYQIFGDWAMWKYVRPYNPQYDTWSDTDIDTTIEDKQVNDKVRVRVRESTLSNELSIYCNKVLMTPPGLKMDEDEYSLIVQQASSLYPTGFVYGRSFMDNLRPYYGVKDVLTSVLVDRARQDLEPPLKSRFRTLVNRYMFKPASVTPYQGEGDLTPLLPTAAVNNSVFEAIKIYDQMAKDASPSPILQVQQGGGDKTRRQIELEMQGAIRAVAGMVNASVGWRRQESRLKLSLALKHFAKITGFTFQVDGSSGLEGKLVEIGKVPSTKKAILATIKKMSEAQNLAKKKGKPVKRYLVDAEKTKDYSFVINYRVNPHQRDSESADVQEIKEKIGIYQNLQIDPKALQKMAVRAFHDDEDELVPQQQAQPQMPQMSQMGPQNAAQNQPGGANMQPQMQGMPQVPNPQMQPQV